MSVIKWKATKKGIKEGKFRVFYTKGNKQYSYDGKVWHTFSRDIVAHMIEHVKKGLYTGDFKYYSELCS